MADTKISGLPASTTPLAGTEELPIVQSGVTKKVSVANVTAGRAISATQMTLTTGNLIVASGQGIDFSATPGTGTSELLSDYEEGTWTPSVSSTAGTITTVGAVIGRYTKIGRVVHTFWQIAITDNGTGFGAITIAGFPFTASTAISFYSGGGYANNTGVGLTSAFSTPSGPLFVRNAVGTYPGATGEILYGFISYEV
jgi:hypothetical protein